MQHAIVSHSDWLAARKDLLKAEKDLTRLRDKVAQDRLALPWARVDKAYIFDTPDGKRSLPELFDGRSQLLVQHFMLGPGWKEGCPSCSFMADHTDGWNLHLARHDATMIAVTGAFQLLHDCPAHGDGLRECRLHIRHVDVDMGFDCLRHFPHHDDRVIYPRLGVGDPGPVLSLMNTQSGCAEDGFDNVESFDATGSFAPSGWQPVSVVESTR